jgi:hypothetical protein
MAPWLIPALKAVLPHVGTIITAAAPAFTKKNADAANQAQLLQQQVTELQAAASQNAVHIKELAAQLQSTLTALEQAASIAEARLRRTYAACILAFAVSAIALAISLSMLFAR